MEAEEFPDEMVAQARQALRMDLNCYNIAVVGQSGVGKSALVNGLRHLRNNHKDAAPVGEIETTSNIEKYVHPIIPQLMLWDVPGAGTLTHPACTYFSEKMLYAFDCILIISADRFMQVDFEIAKKAKENKMACAFVRTKADLAVKAIVQRMHNKLMLEASKDLRKKVDESLQKGLKNMGFSKETSTFPYFIVSAWAFIRPNAYTATTRDRDSSLEKMDEEQLLVFIMNLIRAREKERQG